MDKNRTVVNYWPTTDIGLGDRHVTWKSRAVWKDLGSRRIGKSLEGVRVRSDVKGHGFLMVYTGCAHVQRRLKV